MTDDDDQREATPLLKPTSDSYIPTSPDHSMLVPSAKQQTHNRVVHFFKAFCIPGVAVVRYMIVWIHNFMHHIYCMLFNG